MFCRWFYWQSTGFKVLCLNPWSTKEFVRKCKLFFFNVSTDNSIVESLAWISFHKICSDKSWKLTEIFLYTGIKILNNKNCNVTFGFEYKRGIFLMCVCTILSNAINAYTTYQAGQLGKKPMIWKCENSIHDPLKTWYMEYNRVKQNLSPALPHTCTSRLL